MANSTASIMALHSGGVSLTAGDSNPGALLLEGVLGSSDCPAAVLCSMHEGLTSCYDVGVACGMCTTALTMLTSAVGCPMS